MKASKILKKKEDDAILAYKMWRDGAHELALAIKKLRNGPEKDRLLKSFERNWAKFFPELWDIIKPKIREKSISQLKLLEIQQKDLAKKFEAAGYHDKAAQCLRIAGKARGGYLKKRGD